MSSLNQDTATVRVLSAGALRRGILACAESYTARTGTRIEASFASAPAVADAVESRRADAEVLIAPSDALNAFMVGGLVARRPQHSIGVVRAGVVVRRGAAAPAVATADGLRAALRKADAVIYNRASSGAAVAGMLERLGIADEVGARARQVETGAEVIETVASPDSGNAIGIAQSTEIGRLIGEGAGVTYLGPLPHGAAIETYYMAGLIAGTQNRPTRFFIRFLGGPVARNLLIANGVEPLIARL